MISNKKGASNNSVLITGGSRGIGRGIAHVLSDAGYTVSAVGKSATALFTTVAGCV